MSDLFWLSEAQVARMQPYFPKSHGKPRVDDRRAPKGRPAMLEFELPGAGKVVVVQKGKNMTVTVPGVHIPEEAQSGFQAKLKDLLSEYTRMPTKA